MLSVLPGWRDEPDAEFYRPQLTPSDIQDVDGTPLILMLRDYQIFWETKHTD